MFKFNRLSYTSMAFLLLAMGIFLRLFHLGTHSLDIDEMVTTGLASRQDWGGLTSDTNPPLYIFLLRFWLQWLPHSEFWIRFPAFIASCLSLFIMLWASDPEGRHQPHSLLPLCLLALSAPAIEIGQWARGNSLWEMATLMLMFGSLRSKQLPSILGVLVGSATHWFSFPFSLALLLDNPLAKKFRAWRAYALLVCLILFFTLAAVGVQNASYHLDWQSMRFRAGSFAGDILQQIDLLFGSRYVAIFLLALVALHIHRTKHWLTKSHATWFLFSSLLFAMGLLALCSFTERSLFLLRYMSPIVPLLCWAIPNVTDELRVPKALKNAFYAVLIMAFAHGAYLYNQRPTPVWRQGLQAALSAHPNFLWTTRSIEIAHPYLDGSEIEVRQFRGQPSDTFMIAESARRGTVAVIDNFWGGLLYWDDLKVKLQDLGHKVTVYEINGHTLEPIRLMLIENSSPSGL